MNVNHDPISRTTPIGDAAERKTGTGSLLRASRLRCGEELEDIAQSLRIRRRHLEAIEDGRFDELPGTTYAVGFIRAYADYLGLDSDEVVRRFKEENTLQPGRPPKAELVFPSPMSESGIPRGAVVFLGVLIGVIAYGGWYSSTVDNDFFKNWIEPVPQRLADMVSGGGSPAEPDRSQAVAADKPVEAVDPTPVTTPKPEMAEPEIADTATESATDAPATDAPSIVATSPDPAPTDTASSDALAADTASGASEVTATAPTAVATATESAAETPDATPAPETAAAPAPEPATETSATETVPEPARPPQSIAQPVETAELPAPAAEPSASDNAAAAAPETAAAEGLSSETPNDMAPAAEVADQATAAGTAATEVANVPAIPEGTRIVLTAISDSWVEVRETVTDTWVWGKLLRAGESYPVPDRPNLKLKTGNAGGLTIAVDGTNVPPVGESGEVVRNVLLDPDRLKAGTAASR